MKKKYRSLLICTITLFFLTQFFIHTEEITNAFFNGTILWFNNLLPNIFIFFIISKNCGINNLGFHKNPSY